MLSNEGLSQPQCGEEGRRGEKKAINQIQNIMGIWEVEASGYDFSSALNNFLKP